MSLYAVFVRHGDYHQQAHTPSALQPYALNSNGREQAQACAQLVTALSHELRAPVRSTVQSSVSQRAWQTARILSETLAHKTGQAYVLQEENALCERQVGAFANLSIHAIEAIIEDDPRYESMPQGWKSQSHYCLPGPGTESLMDAGQRVAQHVELVMGRLQQQKSTGMQLFVGHGAAFRHAAYHLGILEEAAVSALSMYHARPVVCEYHSPTNYSHCAGAWKIRQATENVD